MKMHAYLRHGEVTFEEELASLEWGLIRMGATVYPCHGKSLTQSILSLEVLAMTVDSFPLSLMNSM